MAELPDIMLNLHVAHEGASVDATDHHVGTVEGIASEPDGTVSALIVRHGYADYLLAIPLAMVAEANAGRVHLSVPLNVVEALMFDVGGDAGPTAPSPPVNSVLGLVDPAQPDGPSTS